MANKKQEDKPSTQEQVSTSSDNIINKIWNFFSSMKVGVVLLIIVAVMSIIGTIWTARVEGNSPTGSFYNSWYYLIPMGLLLINLMVCSVNRFKQIVLTLKGPKAKVSEATIKNLKVKDSLKIKGSLEVAGKKVQDTLSNHGYRVFTTSEEGNLYYGSDKGRFGILGPYMTHISFMLIIIALWVSFSPIFSYKGFVWAKEGTTFNTQRDVENNMGTFNPNANFDVKVKKVGTNVRADGSVSKYYSDVTVVDNGKEVKSTQIFVNGPLRYKGYSFYQSSMDYGMTSVIDGQTFSSRKLDQNTSFQIPKSDYYIVPTSVNGSVIGYAIYTSKQQQPVKSGEIAMGKSEKFENHTFQLALDTYTGLEVTKDSGKPIVFIGSLFLMVGIAMSFLFRNRRIWAIVTEKNGTAFVEMGGLAQKSKVTLEKEFASITEALKQKGGA